MVALLAGGAPNSLIAQSELPELGNRMSGVFSLEEEHRMGQELLRSVRRSAPTINDPLLEDYVVNMTHNLARHSNLQDSRLEFALIDSPALNAFAAPGGVIGVNGGLFLNAETEAEFASVMAHELAHVSQRHFARGVEDAQERRIPELAAMLASIAIMAGSSGDAGAAAMMAAQGRSIENQLSFSRQNEAEADRIGLQTLYNAGYDPHAMPRLFERMLDMSRFRSQPPEFLLSHPLTESRVSDTASRAERYPARQTEPDLDYQLMRSRMQVRYASESQAAVKDFEQRVNQAEEGPRRIAARYGLALAYQKDEQYDKALSLMDELLEQEPNRIAFTTARAEMLTEQNEPLFALDYLERHLQINPGNHPLTMARADALIAAQRYGEAVEVLEKHANGRPNDHQLWYLIAETQGMAGNISKVHQARAEYFRLVGDFRSAREQLSYALRIETQRDDNQPLIASLRQRVSRVEQLQRQQQQQNR